MTKQTIQQESIRVEKFGATASVLGNRAALTKEFRPEDIESEIGIKADYIHAIASVIANSTENFGLMADSIQANVFHLIAHLSSEINVLSELSGRIDGARRRAAMGKSDGDIPPQQDRQS